MHPDLQHVFNAAEISRRSTHGELCHKLGKAIFEKRLPLTRRKFVEKLGFDKISVEDQLSILIALESYDPDSAESPTYVEPYVVSQVLDIRLGLVFDFLKALKEKIKYRP